MSPLTEYSLSRRQFYRSKDPTNSIKVLKEKCYKTKRNPQKANNTKYSKTKLANSVAPYNPLLANEVGLFYSS